MKTVLRRLLYMVMMMCMLAGILSVSAQAEDGMEDYSEEYSDGATDDSQGAVSTGMFYVYDEKGILSQDEIDSLNSKAAEISAAYNSGTYIVIIKDYSDYGSSVVNAAENIYKSMNFGVGDDNNGEVLLLSMADRDYSLTVKGHAANEAFSEYARSTVEEVFLDDFHDDNWYNGFNDYLDKSKELLQLAADGHPLTRESSTLYKLAKWGISVLIGIILAIIIGLGIKSTMKSVAAKVEARNYVKDGSFDISYRNDYFKYSTETRTKIEKKSSSSDSGGFSSSSGKF